MCFGFGSVVCGFLTHTAKQDYHSENLGPLLQGKFGNIFVEDAGGELLMLPEIADFDECSGF